MTSMCEETWRLVCILDRPIRGTRGTLSLIDHPIHEGSMDDHHLRLAEQWLRDTADIIAEKRNTMLVKKGEAA